MMYVVHVVAEMASCVDRLTDFGNTDSKAQYAADETDLISDVQLRLTTQPSTCLSQQQPVHTEASGAKSEKLLDLQKGTIQY